MAMINMWIQRAALLFLAMTGMAQAAGEGHHEMTVSAPLLWNPEIPFWPGHTLPISNSLVMMVIAMLLITLFLRLSTRKMALVPGKMQNFVEWVFEVLYNFVESLVGRKLAKKYFWYFATVFLLILVSNYIGLVPGVGSITYEGQPLFRGANADLNVTLFLGLMYAVLWFFWVMREQGPVHFVAHLFGPKGGLTGALKYLLMPIFFFVGLIEVLSICIRPVALAARLFGNIFAGELIIEKMSLVSWAAVLPFMALELIVGFVQALVFLMLTAIFLRTQLDDGEEESA